METLFVKFWFILVSLFKGQINFRGLFKAKAIFVEEQ